MKENFIKKSPTRETEQQVAEQIARLYGNGLLKDLQGRQVLNHATIARYFIYKFRLVYNVASKKFMQLILNETYEPVATELVLQKVTSALHLVAKDIDNYPMNELRPSRIRELIAEMRIAGACSPSHPVHPLEHIFALATPV